MRAPRARRRGMAGVIGWLLVILVALGVVTWRQTRGLEQEQRLRERQAERAISEAERLELERRILALSTRTRVLRVARERLGMRLPSDAEIILLPVAVEAEAAFATGPGSGR